jgi:hypothetical protein
MDVVFTRLHDLLHQPGRSLHALLAARRELLLMSTQALDDLAIPVGNAGAKSLDVGTARLCGSSLRECAVAGEHECADDNRRNRGESLGTKPHLEPPLITVPRATLVHGLSSRHARVPAFLREHQSPVRADAPIYREISSPILDAIAFILIRHRL